MNKKLSTSVIARNYKIQPENLFSYLVSELYLYKKGKEYKLTDNGIKLGGSYRKSIEEGTGKEYTVVVWEFDCLNQIITTKFAPNLKDSKYRYPNDFMKIKKEFGKREGVWESLNNGTAILNTEQQLNQYLFSHGAKHNAKLLKAFKELLNEINKKQKIQIIDYGCGQGIASIVFLNELERIKFPISNIEKIILIDPGELAINRAYEFLKKSADVIKINKDIDNISTQDLSTSKDAIKFHLFSNILDMGDKHFDLKKLSDNIVNSQIGDNYFICVSAMNEEKLHEFTEYITSTKINTPSLLELEKIIGMEKDTSKVDFSKETRLPTVKFISYDAEDIDNTSTYSDSKPWKNIHIIFKKEFVK